VAGEDQKANEPDIKSRRAKSPRLPLTRMSGLSQAGLVRLGSKPRPFSALPMERVAADS